jgi:hypothetical protein
MEQKLVHSHLPNCLAEFVTADFPPTDNRPVLAIRQSSSNKCNYELITAVYDPEFRPLDPWVDINGNSILDSGHRVMGWKNAFRWLQAL